MKLKFSLIILVFVLIAAISSTYFYALITRHERRQLVDLRLQTFTERLLETDFLNQTREEFIEAQELRQALQSAGIHWIWRFKELQRSEGLRHLLEILPQRCEGNGFHSFKVMGTYIRCFQVLDEKAHTQILVATALPQGTEPFFETQKLWWYFIFICIASVLISIVLMHWLFKPISKVKSSIEDFLYFIQSEQINAEKFSNYISKANSNQQSSIFDDDTKNLQEKFFVFLDQIEKFIKETKLYSFRVSHEIKTPLAVLASQLSDLGKAPSLGLKERQEVFKIQKNLAELSEFLKSFDLYQELSMPGQITDNLYSLDLFQTANQVKENLDKAHTMLAEDPQGQLSRLVLEEAQKSQRILAHPADLEHAILNLVSNALKYTQGKVLIRVSGYQVQIFDEGEGIPMEVQDQLGEPFNRSKSACSKTKGFGLGLSIVSMICKKYGWRLTFDHKLQNIDELQSGVKYRHSLAHSLTNCVILDMTPLSQESLSESSDFFDFNTK